MTGLSLIHSRAVPCAGRNSSTWPQHRNKTLATNPRRPRRLVAGRLSHYSALYEVQHDQGMPLDAVQHLHHMVHGSNNALGPLYFATFCALSVTLGALLYNLTNVLNEYFALQQQLSKTQEDKPSLYGVDVSSSTMFKSQRVRAAAAFAAAAHAGQVRKTGEPYVTHCIETALIVESNLPHWRHDSRHETAVIAALLHDTLDDTATTPEAITAAFGPTVTAMVVSVSKLSAVNQMLRRDKRKGVVRRDEDFWQSQWRRLKRMMFEAVVEEPLVILVKLADRLHNMRTVYALPPAKQVAVAEETLAVWCSMAASLGWHSLKSEMEDLCFAVLDTSTFCSLRQELDKLWSSPPPPRSRRRVKSSRRQLQLQQFAEQQQQLAAERTAKWGQGLLQRLRQGLGFHRPWQSTVGSSSSSSSEPSAAAADSGSSAGDAATMQGPQHQQLPLQQQQQKPGGLNLLLHGLWPAGASTTAAAAAGSSPAAGGQGLLPAPPMSQPGSTPGQPVTSHEEPKRPSGADWGVTDAALSLRSLLGSSLGGLGSSSSGPTSTATAPAAAPGADAAARPLDVPSSSSSKGSKGQLSAQQQQLRNILSTVVPFDAVSLTGSNPGLTWSAQQGLGVLKEAAGRLYNELAVGSFSGGLKVEIQGRLKSLRSVHNKMERKSCSVEEVFDARALRVVVDDGGGARLADAVQCCYRLVSAVHKLWRPIHGEFDDYIANPKPSGYQALHTAVWGPGGAALEVQIKTAGMHEHAEYGGAAHWQYKEVLWGSAPAAAAAVDNVERNVAAAAAAAGQQLSLADGAVAAAAAAAARRSSNVQVLPTVLFTFDDEGQLVSSSGSSSSSAAGLSASLASYDGGTALLTRPAELAVAATAVAATVSTTAGARTPQQAGYASMRSVAQLAGRPRASQQQQQQRQVVMGSAATPARRKGSPVSTLERPVLQLQQAQRPPLPPSPAQEPAQPAQQPPEQQQQLRPAPGVYVGQPVLRISDRLRYGVVLATSNVGGSSSSGSDASSLLRLSPQVVAAELGLAAAASAAAAGSSSSSDSNRGSSSSSSITCVIMSGGTNPDHPWRMPDYGFYEQLLSYASAQGWNRPGQGDWHARLEEYLWCRDGRWHRRDHLGYLHPHTTLTLLEGYEQDALGTGAGTAAAGAATAAAAAAAATAAATAAAAAAAPPSPPYSRLGAAVGGSSSGSSSSAASAAPAQAPAGGGIEDRRAARAAATAARGAPDAAMLRHSWATGGAASSSSSSSSWRQQQPQQRQSAPVQAAAAAAAVAAAAKKPAAAVAAQQAAVPASSSSRSSEASQPEAASSGSSSSVSLQDGRSSGGGSDGAEPAFAGTAAAAGSDWAATAAKAAQLRSVIEWGLEAYGVNAAGSEPSNEVSVVIWPGGSIEDVPRGTTAGEILREKGVFAILDAAAGTATTSSSSNSDSDAEPVPGGVLVPDGVDGRARLQAEQRQQAEDSPATGGDGGQQQQQQLVNVNNRLVSEDTVLQDGDLVILAREKIKI